MHQYYLLTTFLLIKCRNFLVISTFGKCFSSTICVLLLEYGEQRKFVIYSCNMLHANRCITIWKGTLTVLWQQIGGPVQWISKSRLNLVKSFYWLSNSIIVWNVRWPYIDGEHLNGRGINELNLDTTFYAVLLRMIIIIIIIITIIIIIILTIIIDTGFMFPPSQLSSYKALKMI